MRILTFIRLRRWMAVVISLALVLQIQGGIVSGAAPQLSTVSVSMSNPTCMEVPSAAGVCTLQVDYVSVSGSDPSFSRVELRVNNKLRAFMAGFFESSAYLTSSMMPKGVLVSCGRPNDGGLADYGKSYLVTANAYMADGTSASNSTTVYCPAYDGRTYLPNVKNK